MESKYYFSVGDQVVDISQLYLWNNSFHFSKAINVFKTIQVVQAANEKYFTIYSDIDLDKFNGLFSRSDKDRVCLQGQFVGKTYEYEQPKYWNLTKNREEIIKCLFELKEKELKKFQVLENEQIESLEKRISDLQKQMQDIKDGKMRHIASREIIYREFIDDRINDLLKAIS